MQQARDELSCERTTLVIAHRLSTVQRANQIAVLDQGQVVELGTHAELLSRNGHYSRLYAMQFSETAAKTSAAQAQNIAQLSCRFRSHLSSVLGSLTLLTDRLLNTPDEQYELVEEAYLSAIELFKTLKYLEETTEPLNQVEVK